MNTNEYFYTPGEIIRVRTGVFVVFDSKWDEFSKHFCSAQGLTPDDELVNFARVMNISSIPYTEFLVLHSTKIISGVTRFRATFVKLYNMQHSKVLWVPEESLLGLEERTRVNHVNGTLLETLL